MNITEAEIWVLCILAILVIKEWPKHRDVPFLFKLAHFAFVGLFSLMGVAGLLYLTLILINYKSFKDVFSENVPQSMQSQAFEIAVVIFSIVGAVLFLGALRLGRFRRWGRRVVVILSLPYSALYPIVVSAMTGQAQSAVSGKVLRDLTIILIFLSGAAIMMYSSRRFSKHVSYA